MARPHHIELTANLDKLLVSPHNLFVKRHLAPYAKLLTQASDRLYLTPVWLGGDLLKDASLTLHRLSMHPETFGTLKPCHDAEARRERLSNLLTAARAYVAAERKHSSHPVRQGELPL